MTEPTSTLRELQEDIQREAIRDMAELERTRDEIRVKVHLAGMDAKTSWRALEDRVQLLEERVRREGDHIAEASRGLAKDLRQALEQFKARL